VRPVEKKSEPNVGLSSEPIHVLALWLAILLAWPWNVALSAIESARDDVTVECTARLVAGTHRGHRVNRFGKGIRACCPAISQDYEKNEEEGDECGPSQTPSCLFHFPDSPVALELASGAPAQKVILPRIPVTRLCRLRC
jgi:hypothetical protein